MQLSCQPVHAPYGALLVIYKAMARFLTMGTLILTTRGLLEYAMEPVVERVYGDVSSSYKSRVNGQYVDNLWHD